MNDYNENEDENDLSELREEYSFSDPAQRTNTTTASRSYNVGDDDEIKEDFKDKITDLIKGNMVYALVVAILIVPTVFTLHSMFAEPEVKEVARDLSFSETVTTKDAGDKAEKSMPVAPEQPAQLAPMKQEPLAISPQPETELKTNSQPTVSAETLTDSQQFGSIADSAFSLKHKDDAFFDTKPKPKPKPVLAPAQAEQTAIVKKELAKLGKHLDMMDKAVVKLYSMNSNIAKAQLENSTQQSATTNQLEQISKAIDKLAERFDELSQGIAKQQDPQPEITVEAEEQKEPFIVYAAVPGRAWLRDREGKIITIRPGEILHGFGRVRMIDAKAGTVMSTSGAIFKSE